MPEIKALVASVLQMPPEELHEDDGTDTIAAWDSLKTLLIASMIEIEWGVTLDSRDIEQLTTLRAVRDVVARHVA